MKCYTPFCFLGSGQQDNCLRQVKLELQTNLSYDDFKIHCFECGLTLIIKTNAPTICALGISNYAEQQQPPL